MKVICKVSHEEPDRKEPGRFKSYKARKIYDRDEWSDAYFEPAKEKQKADAESADTKPRGGKKE
ncbi:MAG: hypothetical protein QME66_04685 [Candidatus Eisenbacteria bacterium]|nr:hypothetical protein [Candidatus Eisenbacteria bacterium]